MKPIDLEVTALERDTPTSVQLTLAQPNPQIHPPLQYRSGQYLTFCHEHEGEELRRTYSICTAEQDQVLKVGVRHIQGGAFSTYANETLKVGDALRVLPPAGRFLLPDLPDHAHILMIAAGSGITPIMSHCATLLKRSKTVRVTLIYGNKSPQSSMLRDALEDLKNIYFERFALLNVYSAAPQDIDLLSGRIDTEKCQTLLNRWISPPSSAPVTFAMLCGPKGMISEARAALLDFGLDRNQILQEVFASAPRAHLSEASKPTQAAQLQADKSLTVVLDGSSYDYAVDGSVSVLETALKNQLDAPYSCRAGVCSTCRCRILEGEAEMTVNHALEDDEVEKGYALSCQLQQQSRQLVISYDDAHA